MYALGFPLLLIPFAIYNIVVFIFGLPASVWVAQATSVHMMSGQVWALSWEDILVAVSLVMLWVEVVKSARIGLRTIVDHVLSLLLFIAMLVEFLLVSGAATSTFFLLLIICLVDALGGFIVSIRSSQRQVEVEEPAPR